MHQGFAALLNYKCMKGSPGMSGTALIIETPAPPTAHPESDRLREAMCRVSAADKTWVGTAYRVTSVMRSNEEDLVSGEGSRIWGARWNPPGSFRTVYLSLDHSTAMAEYLAQNRRQGLPDHAAMPAVTAGVNLNLRRVLDLNDRSVRRALRLTRTSMTSGSHDPSPVEHLTQAIGRLAQSEGYEAILVPSAARRLSINIVVFPDKLSRGQMLPINADKLPKK
jgi:RES domain-containing protein